jgi:hypothetical protein
MQVKIKSYFLMTPKVGKSMGNGDGGRAPAKPQAAVAEQTGRDNKLELQLDWDERKYGEF